MNVAFQKGALINTPSPLRTASLWLIPILLLLAWPANSVQAFPIRTITAPTAPKGALLVRTPIQLVQLEGDSSMLAAPLLASYGIMGDLTLTLRPMYISKTIKGETTSGIGDTLLLAKYRLYRKDAPAASRQIAIFGGVSLPTGEDDERDKNGDLLPPPRQPGTGSTDPLFGMSYTDRLNVRFAWHGFLLYRLTTEGSQDFEVGDTLQYGLATEWRVVLRPTVSVVGELVGEFAQRSKDKGTTVSDSGGNTLFFSPGFQIVPLRNLVLEVSAQLPIVQSLNGDQLETDYGLIFGLWYLY